jgi:uncharacterized membrane protein YphA (DoxX/SURF4 family)
VFIDTLQSALFNTAAVAVGAVLLAAGATKAGDLRAFVEGVAAYQLLPAPLVLPASYGVVAIEIVCGACLISGLAVAPAAFAAAGLSLVFVVAISKALIRGRNLPCACFGDDAETASSGTLMRAVLLVVLGVVVFALDARGIARPVDATSLVLAITAGFGLAVALRLVGLIPVAVSLLLRRATIDGSLASQSIDLSHVSLDTPIFGPYPKAPPPVVIGIR